MQADHKTVSTLLKTARGQIDGILKMIEDDRYCMDISNQLLATESILRRANKEILAAHMRACVKASFETGSEAEQAAKVDEIVALLDKLNK